MKNKIQVKWAFLEGLIIIGICFITYVILFGGDNKPATVTDSTISQVENENVGPTVVTPSSTSTRFLVGDTELVKGGRVMLNVLTDTDTGVEYLISDNSIVALKSEEDKENERMLKEAAVSLAAIIEEQKNLLEELTKKVENQNTEIKDLTSEIRDVENAIKEESKREGN